MLSQPGDLSSGLLTQLGNYFQKPPTPTPGLAQSQTWEGNAQPAGSFPASRNSLGVAGMNGAALTGAASGLQAAAQSLLRQRMEALRQQGVGLRGAFTPAPPSLGQWEVIMQPVMPQKLHMQVAGQQLQCLLLSHGHRCWVALDVCVESYLNSLKYIDVVPWLRTRLLSGS